MQLETINKLYLELSQVATAKTATHIELDKARAENKRARALIFKIFNSDDFLSLPENIRLDVESIVNGEPAPEGEKK